MEKILGIDLGSNSIGWLIRDPLAEDNQFEQTGTLTFKKGVATIEGKESPKVQLRTNKRGIRRNYEARKYRKQLMLKILMQYNMCPLSKCELVAWKRYDKNKPKKYPQSKDFLNWLRLDFDGDGNPEFLNPYLLRKLAVEEKIENLHILGRVFYHLVQRRGFKGRDAGMAKGILEGTKDSAAKGANTIKSFIVESENIFLGAALLKRQNATNERIREQYNIRADFESELKAICEQQKVEDSLYKLLHKAILWQRPLRTQKGNVGLCTFEKMIENEQGKVIQKGRHRSALSQPLFEDYRAWQLINNLKIVDAEGNPATVSWLKEHILPVFASSRERTFSLSKINSACKDKKHGDNKHSITAKYNYSSDAKSNNKVDTFSTSYTCYWLKYLLGENWREDFSEERKLNKIIPYSFLDIWHILHTAADDSEEILHKFAIEKMNWDGEKAEVFSKISLANGYSNLSVTAITKILPHLQRGMLYNNAVLMANIPTLLKRSALGDAEIKELEVIFDQLHAKIEQSRLENKIVNDLIAQHQNLPYNEKFWYDDGRKLNEEDLEAITEVIAFFDAEISYRMKSESEKTQFRAVVDEKYLAYLQRNAPQRTFYPTPSLSDKLKQLLCEKYNLDKEQVERLYHHSDFDIYPPSSDGRLGDPVPPSKGFKNPMALQTLHHLKHLVNHLLDTQKINEDTRIVVEVGRDLNDANKRAAIDRYDRERKTLRATYKKEMDEMKAKYNLSIDTDAEDVFRRYFLWKEQTNDCVYCKEKMSCADVFDGSATQLEHTIPASMSFNDELNNLTLAHTACNTAKGKRIPYDLPDYKTIIVHKIKYIEVKVAEFETKVQKDLRSARANADNKIEKDKAIQSRHFNKTHLDYWRKKLDSFTISEYKPSWRNSQLKDTQVSTKYAFHYLKTVFHKVEVQKGNVTAAFRDIFSFPKKTRDRHSHHAIDAAVLTCIPKSPLREQYLKAHYECKEQNINDYNKHEFFLKNTRKPYKSYAYSHYEHIDTEVLINNITTDRTFLPAKKKLRIRGKIQYVKVLDANGVLDFKKDDEGNRIPKWNTGSTLRGSLHKESFFGAVRLPQYEEDGKTPKRNEKGEHLLQQKKGGGDNIFMVERWQLSSFTKLEDLEKIIDPALKEYLTNEVYARTSNGSSFLDAMKEPIYAFGKTEDKHGRALRPLRHIRCKVAAGRGVLGFDKAIAIRQHDFSSKHDYKKSVYAQNDSMVACVLYESTDDEKAERDFSIHGLFEVSLLGKEYLKTFEKLPKTISDIFYADSRFQSVRTCLGI